MTTATVQKKINTNIRIAPELKEEVLKVAEKMGLNFTSVINLLLHKFVLEKKIEIGIKDFEAENFSTDEMKKIKNLKNFNSFMGAVEGSLG